MGLAILQTAKPALGFNYLALGSVIGNALNAPQYGGNPVQSPGLTLGSGTNQINLIATIISSIVASGNATLNLNSITDIRGQTVNFTRIKGWMLWLLSATDDTVTPGSAASSVTVGNAATPFPFNLGVATNTFTIENGECVTRHTQSAAGVLTSGANNVKIVNNDAGLTAKFLSVFWGSDI